MTQTLNRAAKNGFVDFKAVKAAINFVQVLERYDLIDSLKKSGDRLSGICPIHGGSNPTQFRVSISKNCFNCFGQCGRGGNVIDFVALMEDVPFREAALLLQDWFMPDAANDPSSDRNAHSSKKQNRNDIGDSSSSEFESSADEETGDDTVVAENVPLTFELKTLKTDHPYFEERGISAAAIDRFGLGYCSRGCLRGRIAIPIHNRNGELVAYAGRWPGDPPKDEPKYKLPKGFRKSLEMFNWHRASREPEHHPLVIVEGFFDCIALWEAGIFKCVALMGSALSPTQAETIRDSLSDDSEIEVLFDADETGRHGAEAISHEFAEHARVRVIDLPDEGMQPDHLNADELAVIFE